MYEEQIAIYNNSLKAGVFEFTEKCFNELGKPFEPEGRHSFYSDIDGGFDRFWCLLSDGIVEGTVAVRRMDDTTAELKAMYLSKSLRGRGYGYKMLDLAVNYCKYRGYKRIVLDSMSSYTDALRLYKRYGFNETERYNDNQKADVFMEYDLEGTS